MPAPDPYEIGLLVVGVSALVAAWAQGALRNRPMSVPIVLVLLGVGAFALPVGIAVPHPGAHLSVTERLAEVGVLVSLMGAGLKLDRPLGWRSWQVTWRLLAIAMPLTIGGVALASAGLLGLGAASAVLLGAVLAPTDPVLAAEVQVGEPTVGDDEPADGVPGEAGTADGEAATGAAPATAAPHEDEVRFALTSEAGLNDGLAFPAVYLAIGLAGHAGTGGAWLWSWFGWDLVGRVAIALVVGVGVGRLLGLVLFRLTGLAASIEGFLAIAVTLMAYGATEVVGGYGFLAVFVAALALRGVERRHEAHRVLHGFTEQAERLIVVGLLLLLGGSVAGGLLGGLRISEVVVALLVVFVIRPLAGWASLPGTRTDGAERQTIAWFGIRGIGSIYYLAYGLGAAAFTGATVLWRVMTVTLLVSIVVHGVAATPVMRALDVRARRRAARRARARSGAGSGAVEGLASRPPR